MGEGKKILKEKIEKQKPIMLVWIRRTMPRRLVVEISK